jgi:hypothetical protein
MLMACFKVGSANRGHLFAVCPYSALCFSLTGLFATDIFVFLNFMLLRTVHFGFKLYNDQRNAQVLIYLSIYFCLTCFGLAFSPSSEAGVQFRQWFKSAGCGVSNLTLAPYPAIKHSINFIAEP